MDIEKIHSLISHAADKEPVSFAEILDDLLAQKAVELVNAEREEVAANYFADDEDGEQTEGDQDGFDDNEDDSDEETQ